MLGTDSRPREDGGATCEWYAKAGEPEGGSDGDHDVQATATHGETKREMPSDGESVTRSDFWVVAEAPLS
jgi:hypothetical protein